MVESSIGNNGAGNKAMITAVVLVLVVLIVIFVVYSL